MVKFLSDKNQHDELIHGALEKLGKLIGDELEKMQDAVDLPDFERRGKVLTVLTKAIQNIRDLIAELKSQASSKDEAIESVMEFREELSRKIQALSGAHDNRQICSDPETE